uniref:Uncharacterized protein n=1 Tax=Sphaerodactylus townsendi TaxID=933632 RepID=A0ACB8G3A0_9SAUR
MEEEGRWIEVTKERMERDGEEKNGGVKSQSGEGERNCWTLPAAEPRLRDRAAEGALPEEGRSCTIQKDPSTFSMPMIVVFTGEQHLAKKLGKIMPPGMTVGNPLQNDLAVDLEVEAE